MGYYRNTQNDRNDFLVLSIQSLDGREIGQFKARRVYTWSGDVMELESTLVLGDREHTDSADLTGT